MKATWQAACGDDGHSSQAHLVAIARGLVSLNANKLSKEVLIAASRRSSRSMAQPSP